MTDIFSEGVGELPVLCNVESVIDVVTLIGPLGDGEEIGTHTRKNKDCKNNGDRSYAVANGPLFSIDVDERISH